MAAPWLDDSSVRAEAQRVTDEWRLDNQWRQVSLPYEGVCDAGPGGNYSPHNFSPNGQMVWQTLRGDRMRCTVHAPVYPYAQEDDG